MKTIPWKIAYVAQYGYVSIQQLEAWTAYLEAKLPGICQDEIDIAVDWMMSRPGPKSDVTPGINQILSAILHLRRSKKEPAKYDTEWMSRIRSAGPQEAWRIICEPSTSRECEFRERYCRTNGIAYEAFKPDAISITGAIQDAAAESVNYDAQRKEQLRLYKAQQGGKGKT